MSRSSPIFSFLSFFLVLLISRLSFLATILMSSRWVYHHRGEPASYWSGILGTAGPRLRLPKHNTTHHYILPRSLCITILPFLVGTAALCLEIPISVVIRVGAGNDAIPTFDFSVGSGCTITPFTLAIVQSKFSFFALFDGGMDMVCTGFSSCTHGPG